ncbi:hypothetical protein ACLKA6_000875 [Drosophila palustris]
MSLKREQSQPEKRNEGVRLTLCPLSDTESADIKATSTSTATATTTATTAGGATNEEQQQQGEAEAEGQEREMPTGKKMKPRLPAFAVAILKRFNEKDAGKSKDNKDNAETTAAGTNEQTQDNNTTTTATATTTTTIDGNDNEPKQDKQLVYAELVLKPAQEKTPVATATTTATTPAATTIATTPVDSAAKNATEYAEIVYVQKGEGKK